MSSSELASSDIAVLCIQNIDYLSSTASQFYNQMYPGFTSWELSGMYQVNN